MRFQSKATKYAKPFKSSQIVKTKSDTKCKKVKLQQTHKSNRKYWFAYVCNFSALRKFPDSCRMKFLSI